MLLKTLRSETSLGLKTKYMLVFRNEDGLPDHDEAVIDYCADDETSSRAAFYKVKEWANQGAVVERIFSNADAMLVVVCSIPEKS